MIHTCRNFYERFKTLSLKMKAWHVNRRRRASRKRKRREGDGRGGWDDGEGGKRVEKSQCKSCSLLLVADNSFYKEVRSIIVHYSL